ncbi:MAG: hypothetical protein AAGE80_06030 [Pseudomonadota bacterium]
MKAGTSFFVFTALFIAVLAWRFLGVPTLAGAAGATSDTFTLMLNIALPITGLLALWGLYEFWGAVANREPTVIGDASGLTLTSGDDVIGPFAWSEVFRIAVKQLPGRRRVVAISLRNPEVSLERFPSSIEKYRWFLAHEDDLVLPPALFDTAIEQAAQDLEAMRSFYAPNDF